MKKEKKLHGFSNYKNMSNFQGIYLSTNLLFLKNDEVNTNVQNFDFFGPIACKKSLFHKFIIDYVPKQYLKNFLHFLMYIYISYILHKSMPEAIFEKIYVNQ